MENISVLDQPASAALVEVSQKEAINGLLKIINRRDRQILILVAGLIVVSVLAGIGFFRHPRVLVSVLTPDGQRITQIDDTKFGTSEQIQMGDDNLTDKDKQELVNNFLQTFYAVDLASRSKDVPKALSMMIPESAKSYYKTLNEQGFLQKERDEGWSSSWKTDSFEVDRNDKNSVQVIGTQQLRRMIGGKPINERVQYKIQFSLHTEGKRENSPLRTGYWIVNFKSEELSRTQES